MTKPTRRVSMSPVAEQSLQTVTGGDSRFNEQATLSSNVQKKLDDVSGQQQKLG
jgi:hypothetical protein